MNKIAPLIAAIVLGWGAFVCAEESPLKPLLGSHPIISYMGDETVSGTVEVVDDGTLVGFKLRGLPLATTGVPDHDLLSAKATTMIQAQGQVITHDWHVGDDEIKIEYKLESGFVVVKSKQCNPTVGCVPYDFSFSTGAAPGELWLQDNLLTVAAGKYEVISAAGHAPKPSSSVADIQKGTGEVLFIMPYCNETICDQGYYFFPVADTTILKTNLGPDGDLYRIFLMAEGKLNYFTLQVMTDKTIFKNHQYLMIPDEKIVCLELVLKKTN